MQKTACCTSSSATTWGAHSSSPAPADLWSARSSSRHAHRVLREGETQYESVKQQINHTYTGQYSDAAEISLTF